MVVFPFAKNYNSFNFCRSKDILSTFIGSTDLAKIESNSFKILIKSPFSYKK